MISRTPLTRPVLAFVALCAACAPETGADPAPLQQAAAAAPSESSVAVDPVAAAVPLPADAPRVTPGAMEPLEIATSRGPVGLQVEIADDAAEQQQGLMWRGSMPADRGMLFDFGGEGPRSFWMRNTYIPLDLIFIRADGRIHSIARNATPLSDAPVPSGGPVRGVLEINAGLAERLGINPGDQVRHRFFQ